MRGKRVGKRSWFVKLGLIPAHAGKTECTQTLYRVSPAHPRACGENTKGGTTLHQPLGSSPRMRGKHASHEGRLSKTGLIPAHAGKTCTVVFSASPAAAHPRACGENSVAYVVAAYFGGSSPRMRGKLFGEGNRDHDARLIPAHAGKTCGVTACVCLLRAHPRACGENTERSGVLALRSVRSWKTLSFLSSLKVTHCRAFVQLPFSRIRL